MNSSSSRLPTPRGDVDFGSMFYGQAREIKARRTGRATHRAQQLMHLDPVTLGARAQSALDGANGGLDAD